MAARGHRRQTRVLRPREVVDDETLHPGVVVWLGEPRLCDDEQARFALAAGHHAGGRTTGPTTWPDDVT